MLWRCFRLKREKDRREAGPIALNGSLVLATLRARAMDRKTSQKSEKLTHRFFVNHPVNFKNFEIKNSKKTRDSFKIFGQNRIQKIKIKQSAKFNLFHEDRGAAR
jgi:hypothetical protein